jgi:hypothetical protein
MPEPVPQRESRHDLLPFLDQELGRLPDKYRAVIVLCDLEGKTRKEAAGQLRVPEGTVASRLATARTLLAKRLARHGPPVSGAALAAVLAQELATASVPASVSLATIKAGHLFAAASGAAGAAISARASALAEGVLKTMLLVKLKVATVVLVAVGLIGMAAAAVTQRRSGDDPVEQPVRPSRALAYAPAPEPSLPRRLPADVVAPWKEAGAHVGWMRLSPTDQRFVHFVHRESEAQPGDVPAFYIERWQEGSIAKLPAPWSAFGLRFYTQLTTEMTDERLKELAAFRSLGICPNPPRPTKGSRGWPG